MPHSALTSNWHLNRTENLKKFLQLFPHYATEKAVVFYCRKATDVEMVKAVVETGGIEVESDSSYIHTAALNYGQGV